MQEYAETDIFPTLRAVKETDYPYLFSMRTDMDDLYLWESCYYFPSPKRYYEELDKRNKIDLFFVISTKQSATPIGMVYSFKTDLVNGYAFFAGFLKSEYRQKKIGTLSSIFFINYLFDFLPINKLYADVIEYNLASLALIRNLGFVEEGYFKEHFYYKGKRWSNHRFAFYKSYHGYANLKLTHLAVGCASKIDPPRFLSGILVRRTSRTGGKEYARDESI